MTKAVTIKENHFANKLMDIATGLVVVINTDGVVTHINKSGCRILGCKKSEVVGKNWFDCFWPQKTGRPAKKSFKNVMAGKAKLAGTQKSSLLTVNGEENLFYWQSKLLKEESGKIIGMISSAEDMTGRNHLEKQLADMAHRDTLTDLPNRNLFFDRLQQMIFQAKRNKTMLAVLFLDLDRFKDVNDTLGHDMGDLLLKEVAAKLRGCIRQSDTLARMGGDEFTIILTPISNEVDVAMVAKKVIDCLNEPFLIMGHEFYIGVSIGIALYPSDSENGETLLSQADSAMYEAKKTNCNNYQYYAPDMNLHALETMAMGNDLRKAIDNEELVLFYQPQIDVNTNLIVGTEALVRWQHPNLGLIPPNKFIPLAEKSGLISRIDEWVARTACRQNKAWQEAGMPLIRVAVNVSGASFMEDGYFRRLLEIIGETGLSPEFFELEITENILMNNIEKITKELECLRGAGLCIAIDDFGTGYSSLSYLKHLPVDKLKIDLSFIRNIDNDQSDLSIVSAIIAMGHAMNITVIAEGVENKEQLRLLHSLKCDEAQGYLFKRPVSSDEIAHLLCDKTWHF